MKRDKRLTINIGIYHSKILVIFTEDLKSCIKKHLKKNKIRWEDDYLNSDAFFISNGGNYTLIYKLDANYDDIIHEFAHAAVHILSDHDIPINSEVDEPLTYLIAHIGSKIFDKLEKIKKEDEIQKHRQVQGGSNILRGE